MSGDAIAVIATPAMELSAQTVEQVLLGGDLSKLTPQQRVAYYMRVCESVGLNPLTKPFDYITLNGKLTLYARKDATDQLRKRNLISVCIVSTELSGDIYCVRARATTPEGRQDESLGAVSVSSLKGESLANAMMKTETKAKRRVTLSICGLGILDETEIETISTAQAATVDQRTGEMMGAAQDAPPRQTGPAHITESQRRRLFAVAKANGKNDAQLQAFLATCGISHTSKILASQYDDLISALEAKQEPIGSGEQASTEKAE